jgi:hypothetical protein
MAALERTAIFDPTGQYRYVLTRRWQPGPQLTLILLNPSRADHRQDDPTLRRCLGLAQGWGYSAITVVNLFAYCTPYPQALRQSADPIGPDNDAYLCQACGELSPIVLAWGNQGAWRDRAARVLKLLHPWRSRFHCLGMNRTGQPRHPLYVPRHTLLQPWPVEAQSVPLGH